MAITPEMGDTAEALGRYFQNPSYVSSAHVNVDNNSFTQCVSLRDVAYAAPGANHNGIQIEHAGKQSQTREQFLDAYGQAMFKLSAKIQARICKKANIPVVWLSVSDLRAHRRGITSHDNVSKAWGRSSHYDGRVPFPNWWLLKEIRKEMKKLDAKPLEGEFFKKMPPTLRFKDREPRWRILQAQRFLNQVRAQHGNQPIKLTGIFNKETLYAVKAFQKAHGLDPDGVIGPMTWKILWQHREYGHA